MDAEFVNGGAVAFGGSDRDRVGAVHEPFNHVIKKGFHR
jgi:hypothetical protein